MRMEFPFILTVLLSFMVCQAKIKDASSSIPSALTYWNHKLPNTPIPTILLHRLSSMHPNWSSYHNHTENSIADALLKYFTPYAHDFKGKEPTTIDSFGPIFFLEKNLGIGTKFTMDLVRWKSSETLYLIPVDVANEIPFSTKKLFLSLHKLHIPPDSGMALTMKETLEECESSAMKGESKRCATSLECMIDYATFEIGTTDVNVFVANISKTPKLGLEQYSVASIAFARKSTSRVVTCHTIGYAYLVYFCHQIKDTRMFQVSLKTDEGNVADMVAICHEDTSQWSPEHVSFKLLNVKPGGEAICHFMTEDGIVWLPAN